MKISRVWAMPNADTFSVGPIGVFVRHYMRESKVSVDPFARNKRWATHTNDLNPDTAAEHHLEAGEFLRKMSDSGVRADTVLFDPPYSARQVKECYAGVGRQMTMQDAQGSTWSIWRDEVLRVCADGAIVLSFGWNSVGMGIGRGFEMIELMLVCHGGMHNDTICIAERRLPRQPTLFDQL